MTNQRPFYLMAHRCNNSGDIKNALQKGANAIECDVQYGEDDNNWCVNHDGYRPKYSMMLKDWLKEAYDQSDNVNFCFIYLDIKSPEYLQNLINYVHNNTADFLEKGKRPIAIIYCISSIEKAKEPFTSCASILRDTEGFTVDMFNNPDEVKECFQNIINSEKAKGNSFNRFFYGQGIEAGMPDTKARREKVKKACDIRDKDGVFKKVYTWTIEKESTALKYLEIGVDGIMTNAGGGDCPRDKIANIKEAIEEYNKEKCVVHVRLAVASDKMFEVF